MGQPGLKEEGIARAQQMRLALDIILELALQAVDQLMAAVAHLLLAAASPRLKRDLKGI